MKLKGAIIGYGFISSKGHVPAYKARSINYKDVDIIAVCDIEPKRIAAAKNDFPNIKTYTDHNQMLDELSDQLDFVDISSPAYAHFGAAQKALEANLHVLCEKPLTTTIDDAKSLLSMAAKYKKVVFPCHNYKYAPVVRAINEIIDSGQVGTISSVTLQTFRNTHAKGVDEWKPDWRRSLEFSGGGIAMDHGSHSLYLIFDWLKNYPTELTSSMCNMDKKYDTEDNFDATLNFGNKRAQIHLTWTAGVRKVIYTLQGEKGAITVDDDKMQIATMHTDDSNDNISHKAYWKINVVDIKSDWMDSSHTTWFNAMFDKFKLAIHNNDYCNKDLIDSYYCIETINKCYQSANADSKKISINKLT